MRTDILDAVAGYYTGKLSQHGPTPPGVDWNGEESQLLRFKQLIKIIEPHTRFSITDFGCGYGALYRFLQNAFPSFQYVGYDISVNMVEEASRLHAQSPDCEWTSNQRSLRQMDYVVASGIFNVRLKYKENEWEEYVLETLHFIHEHSIKGFSFNMLTSYSDEDRKRNDLYYADPMFYFQYCKKHFSKYVAVLHDYQLYEFTILIRKENG